MSAAQTTEQLAIRRDNLASHIAVLMTVPYNVTEYYDIDTLIAAYRAIADEIARRGLDLTGTEAD